MRIIALVFILSGLFGATSVRAGEVIDRIVASVNGHVILASEVDEAVSYQAFADNRACNLIVPDQHKAALDRLIDQELIREEVHGSDYEPASPAEVDSRIADLRKLHADVADEGSWLRALDGCGLTSAELREQVTGELNSWKAVETRLRPNVAIDSRSVERYYQQNFLPQLRRRGASEIPLSAVAAEIKEILAQQQINDLLTAWLKSLRTESNIQIAFVASIAPAGGSR